MKQTDDSFRLAARQTENADLVNKCLFNLIYIQVHYSTVACVSNLNVKYESKATETQKMSIFNIVVLQIKSYLVYNSVRSVTLK